MKVKDKFSKTKIINITTNLGIPTSKKLDIGKMIKFFMENRRFRWFRGKHVQKLKNRL